MRTKLVLAAALAATVLSGCNSASEPVAEAPAYSAKQYRSAIDDIARLDDRKDDEARKPGELLAFAQIDKGEVVADYLMGSGYVTRLLAIAVGANGKVYAVQPDEIIAQFPNLAEAQDVAVAPYADERGEPVRVFPLRGPMAQPPFPEPLDTIITVMNFHDLYTAKRPEGTAENTIKSFFDALKPGGTLVVVDHRAADGAGAQAAEEFHRMDRELALKDLTAAGFVLDEESDLYAQAGDPHTVGVFDESIRGKTDKFALRLRKPE
ncbi:class I SAM-dependent methyltransferase [Altererythrobacter sp.]|uniref:class I SAM-dependent methyltransferase n=1 Tax=Altererythrobacter sp. TaxID=1872480 RepID=UPI003D008D9C